MHPQLETYKRLMYAERFFLQFDLSEPVAGDLFFENFTVGNYNAITDQPYERFCDYEALLKRLKNIDTQKYEVIHKGTPFYFMAWLSFQTHSYEKAVYYMDAAISEDIRKVIYYHKRENINEEKTDDELSSLLLNQWIHNPSGRFFTLDDSSLDQAAKRITEHLSKACQNQITRFNSITNNNISKEDFINKFILELAKKSSSRSIITALYSFILEYNDIQDLILLRSMTGGSLEPILTFLFKGGLIFESLLKLKYHTNDRGRPITTIGGMKHNCAFTSKYVSEIDSSATTLREIIDEIDDLTTVQTAFNTAAKVRNTTGHNLRWDDVFDNPENLEKLFNQIINAYLFICQNDFLT